MPAANPDAPRVKAKQADLSTQISTAIAEGFSVVLHSERSQRAEADASMRDMARSLRMIHDILDSQARAAGAGLPGAGPSAAAAEARAREAHASARRLLAPQENTPPVELGQRLDPAPLPAPQPFSMDDRIKQTREGIRQGIYNRVVGGSNEWVYSPFGGPNGVLHNPNGGMSKVLPNQHFADGSDQRTMIQGIHFDSLGRLRDVNGKFVPKHAIQEMTEKEVARLGRRQAIARTTSQVADMWRSGEPIGRSLMSVLPEGTLKGLGVAGLAYTAGMQGMEFLQGQVNAQRNFQQYYGGDLTDNLGDRFDQWWNTNLTKRLSPFGSEAYSSLFQTAMRHGIRGDERDAFINQGSKIYGTGASIEQTTKLLEAALAASNSLDGLAKSISNVNKTARAAKVSAVEAREIFIKNYEASSQVLFGQSAATQAAATTFTNASVGLGEAFAGSVDFTGTISNRTQMYANATRLGMTIGDYQRAMAANPNLGIMAASMGIKQTLGSYVGGSGKTIQQVIDEYRTKLNGRRISTEDLDAIGQELLNNGYDGTLLQSMLHLQGVETTEMLAPSVAASYFLGLDPGSVAARQIQTNRENLQGNVFDASTTAVQILATDNSVAPSQFSERFGTSQDWDQTLIDAYTKYDGATDTNVFTHSMSKVEQALLSDPSKYGIDPNSKVAVQTASGRRVVKFSDALRYYSDQIANGSAMFIDGNEDVQNKTVAEVVGLGAEFTSKVATSASDTSIPEVGQSYTSYTKQAGKDSEEESVDKLLIDLQPEVKNLLLLMVNGSPYAGGPTS